jgi:hypothetical protein
LFLAIFSRETLLVGHVEHQIMLVQLVESEGYSNVGKVANRVWRP